MDWSGAGKDSRVRVPGIWRAAWNERRGITLEGCLSREEVVRGLIAEARLGSLVAGLDFSFSFPAWFVGEHGESAPAVWQAASREGEQWLAGPAYPFWRAGRPEYPAGKPEYRRTELEQPGRRPSSTFKLVGDGQVGTGSVRGMPGLLRLREAGFAVWPFDRAHYPLVLEIYPTACYARAARASEVSRLAWLRAQAPGLLAEEQVSAASSCADAFDALAALLAMLARRESFARLPVARDEVDRLEGRIWTPAVADSS